MLFIIFGFLVIFVLSYMSCFFRVFGYFLLLFILMRVLFVFNNVYFFVGRNFVFLLFLVGFLILLFVKNLGKFLFFFIKS